MYTDRMYVDTENMLKKYKCFYIINDFFYIIIVTLKFW